MRTLAIDIETYSSVDLTKAGVHPYVESEDFEILLLGYAFDGEEVQLVDFKLGDKIPEAVDKALGDSGVLKTAFNASFERVCLGAYLKRNLDPSQWCCTQIRAMALGLPASLEAVGEVLNLPKGKLKEGKNLIKFFTQPLKGGSEGQGGRNLPYDHMARWYDFREYCKRDVEVERTLRGFLKDYPLVERERNLWILDQRINERGVRVDKDFVDKALHCAKTYEEDFVREASILTGLKNPKSCQQMKLWLFEKEDIQVKSLSKEKVEELLEKVESPQVKRALELRKKLSKTSIKKYEAMVRCLTRDGRIKGLLKFYGASRTGRWSGRIVQVQNLPQNNLQGGEEARSLLCEGKYRQLEQDYGSALEVLSQLIRTAFIPSEGCRFIVADFRAIEPRIIAWLAGEGWRQQVFMSHGKIYEASAARMFKVPMESIGKDSPLRQKGKIAELALGYQGGIGALKSMGALSMGVKEEELRELVTHWRNSNPSIVRLWYEIERAALTALRNRTTVSLSHGIEFYLKGDHLFIKLPSGRSLSYFRPRLQLDERFNKYILTYEGVNQVTKQWDRLTTYGGKLTENIVQAIARDCLGEALVGLEGKGYPVVMHIHDEVVLDVPQGFGSLKEVEEIMTREIPWATGLPLAVEIVSTPGGLKKW